MDETTEVYASEERAWLGRVLDEAGYVDVVRSRCHEGRVLFCFRGSVIPIGVGLRPSRGSTGAAVRVGYRSRGDWSRSCWRTLSTSQRWCPPGVVNSGVIWPASAYRAIDRRDNPSAFASSPVVTGSPVMV